MLKLLNKMTNLKVFGFVNKCMKVLRLNSTPCIQKIRRLMSGRQVFQADSIQFSANQNRILPASGKADCIRYAKIFIESTDSRFRIPVFDKLGAFMLGMHTPVKHLRVVKNPQGEMLGGYIGLPLSKDEYFISSMAVAKPKHAPKVLAKIFSKCLSNVRADIFREFAISNIRQARPGSLFTLAAIFSISDTPARTCGNSRKTNAAMHPAIGPRIAGEQVAEYASARYASISAKISPAESNFLIKNFFT